MNKANVFISCTIVLAVTTLFLVNKDRNKSDNLVTNIAVPEMKNLDTPIKGIEPADSATKTKKSQQETVESNNVEPLLNQTHNGTIKQQITTLAVKLDDLAQQLDKNLDNPEKRKEIQAEYLKLTQEYNQLAIQVVKAERASRQLNE